MTWSKAFTNRTQTCSSSVMEPDATGELWTAGRESERASDEEWARVTGKKREREKESETENCWHRSVASRVCLPLLPYVSNAESSNAFHRWRAACRHTHTQSGKEFLNIHRLAFRSFIYTMSFKTYMNSEECAGRSFPWNYNAWGLELLSV